MGLHHVGVVGGAADGCLHDRDCAARGVHRVCGRKDVIAQEVLVPIKIILVLDHLSRSGKGQVSG